MNIGKNGVPLATKRLLDRFDAFVAQRNVSSSGDGEHKDDGFGEFVSAEGADNTGTSTETAFGDWAATSGRFGIQKSRDRRRQKRASRRKGRKRERPKQRRLVVKAGAHGNVQRILVAEKEMFCLFEFI